LAHLEISSNIDLSQFADDITSVTRAQKVSFKQGENTEIEVK
jgi:glutamate synthase domain-containing protein 2